MKDTKGYERYIYGRFKINTESRRKHMSHLHRKALKSQLSCQTIDFLNGMQSTA